MLICYGLHAYQISTQSNTGCSNLLAFFTAVIKAPTDGISFGGTMIITTIWFQRWIESIKRSFEATLEARHGLHTLLTPHWVSHTSPPHFQVCHTNFASPAILLSISEVLKGLGDMAYWEWRPVYKRPLTIPGDTFIRHHWSESALIFSVHD